MYIVDKQIKKMCESGLLIAENYNPENVGAVSYDLTVRNIYVENTKKISYDLEPGKTIFIGTEETLKIPENMIGIVKERNSIMREGLFVSAPNYQPGICSKCFIRVTNISEHIITIEKGKKIAQIMFDTLSDVPDIPYNKQANASFNDEYEYLGKGGISNVTL
jgi:deoxycytidine triphosphate deaminase